MMVFLLVLTGIFLIILNVHATNKDKGSFKENLKSSIENVDENKIKMGKLRIEIAESFLSLQTDVQDLKKENKVLTQRIISLEDKNSVATDIKDIIVKPIEQPIALDLLDQESIGQDSTDNAFKDENNSAIDFKINGVQKLLNMGFSIEEVATKLNTSKGEVILIKNLYQK
jgi:hypothetical protein